MLFSPNSTCMCFSMNVARLLIQGFHLDIKSALNTQIPPEIIDSWHKQASEKRTNKDEQCE